MILLFQQSGLINKLNNEMEWDRQRNSRGTLLTVSASSKSLQGTSVEDRKLTLADTEGMFLLMGIGYLIAFSVLVSEIIGGCARKCRTFIRRPSRISVNSGESTNRPNSSIVLGENEQPMSAQSSSNSFEITTKMLHRKSMQSNSITNPLKSYYMRHRRHHSVIASESERVNLEAKKRFSLEDKSGSSLSDITENGTKPFQVHEVEINRIQTPYTHRYPDDVDDNGSDSIDGAMGERVYN